MKEVKLYGVISNEAFFGMGENGYIERIANEIKDAKDEDIKLKINTPGGSVFDGFAIITNLLEHKGKINMQVDGFAASMGGALLAFADHAAAYDFAKVMLHKASTYSDNDEMLKLLDSLNKQFAEMFKNKGVDADLIDEIFLEVGNKDYWFTAEEAKEIGLIDEVLKSNQTQKLAASGEDYMRKYYELFNNKNNEVEMLGQKEKNLLNTLKGQIQDFLDIKDKLVTEDQIQNFLTKEEIDKVTEEVNTYNTEKVKENNEENKNKIEESVKNITETIKELTESFNDLEKTNTESNEKVGNLEKKLENTIEAILKIDSDFKVEDKEDSETKPLTGVKLQAQIQKDINQFNAEKK